MSLAPSGCGKTTLLNLAAGIILPDAGSVTLDGQPVTSPGPDRAMVFQEHGLFSWLTAAQNIEFGLKMQGLSKSERRDRVAEALQMVHLSQQRKEISTPTFRRNAAARRHRPRDGLEPIRAADG